MRLYLLLNFRRRVVGRLRFRFWSLRLGYYEIRLGPTPNRFHARDESITQAGQSFDDARRSVRLVNRVTQLGHCLVQSMVEVDKGVLRPHFSTQLLARDKFPRVFQQDPKGPQGLRLQTDTAAILPE